MLLPSISTEPVTQGCNQLYTQINMEFRRLQGLLSQGATLVWSNPSGATPQQVVSTMGTQAATIFELSSILCSTLGAFTGSTIGVMPAGWSYTANADGTVTLVAPASSTSTGA